MKLRGLSVLSALVLLLAVLGAILVTSAAAKKKPPLPPPPPPPPASTSTLYVKDYADFLNGAKCDVTPEAVQATADGGAVLLALASCRGTSWVVKLDAYGNPQWQAEVGCFGLPPGGYHYGLSLRQTADGGYVIAGGTSYCESNPVCLYSQCGLVVRLDASGNLVWTRVYSSSARSTGFEDVRQTSDGGFVAVGHFIDGDSAIGASIVKLDGRGNVQWQRLIGPGGPSGPGRMHTFLNAVQQTADGGYVAAGEFYNYLRRPEGDAGVLVVRLDANGDINWQRGFQSFDSSGVPTAHESVSSIIQTSEGGYVVAGTWNNTTGPGTCCQGPLLLKLDAGGRSQWQKAYSAGVHCGGGHPNSCSAIGGLGYFVHQTSDGGYAVGGAAHLVSGGSAPLVPWLAKTDASGNLVWQHVYYQSFSSGSGPLSQYFASSSLTRDGGHLAVGFTGNPFDPNDLKGELFVVRTDSAGLVGACGQIHSATPLNVVDPRLGAIETSFPVQTTIGANGDLPGTRQPTSIRTSGGGC
jgi:hypothetical protein